MNFFSIGFAASHCGELELEAELVTLCELEKRLKMLLKERTSHLSSLESADSTKGVVVNRHLNRTSDDLLDGIARGDNSYRHGSFYRKPTLIHSPGE